MQYSKADLTDPDEREAFYATGSDRAIAILLGAVVETRLTDAIKAKMVANIPKQLTGNLFRPSGPLGSFGLKNQVGYIFGFIPEFLFKEIEIVVKIRNAFAHKVEVKDFTTPEIVSAVNSLQTMSRVTGMANFYGKGTTHVSGIEFGASLLGDYRLCVASYISALRQIESGPWDATAIPPSYFD